MKRLSALLASLLLGVLIGIVTPAFASVAAHFDLKNAWGDDGYEIDSDRLPPFQVGAGSDFYYRARDAANTISAVSGSGLDYIFQGQQAMSQSWWAGDVAFDETWIMDYWSSGVWNYPSCSPTCQLGLTSVQGGSGNAIDRALIYINHDDDLPWYMGTGGVPAGDLDLESTMLHELMHASGLTVDPTSAPECPNYTMCGVATAGSSVRRTLHQHDKDDLAAHY